jgi:hypothetical protein
MLEAEQLLRRFLHEGLDGILIAEPVAASNRVERVFVEAVVGSYRTCRTPLGGDRVAPHRVHLGHDGDVESWIEFGDRDSGAQTGAAAAYQHNVMSWGHLGSPPPTCGSLRRCAEAACIEVWLFRRQEFLHHNAPVVVNDSPAHAAVVILAMEARAPTRELNATRDKVVVVILVVFAV